VKRNLAIGLFIGLLLLAGCAAPASQAPASQPAAPTTAPAAPAPTTAPAPTKAPELTTAPAAAPTSAPEPTQAPAAATAAPAQATQAPAAAAPAAGQIKLVLQPNGTQASYKVKEQLAGRNLPNDAIGITKDVTGTIVINADGTLPAGQSKIVVGLGTLQSDQSRRDNFIKRNTLETDKYPTAVLVPTAVKGLPNPLPNSGDVAFELTGDITVHGTTKPATWKVTGKINGQELDGTAAAAFKFADFNMTPPKVAMVLSLEDHIQLGIDFKALAQN
jgi:polyisoprenoid-binding protein YceI